MSLQTAKIHRQLPKVSASVKPLLLRSSKSQILEMDLTDFSFVKSVPIMLFCISGHSHCVDLR